MFTLKRIHFMSAFFLFLKKSFIYLQGNFKTIKFMGKIGEILSLKEIISEYHWYENDRLIVHVPLYLVEDFGKLLKITDWEDSLVCNLMPNDLGIDQFQEYLLCTYDVDIDDIHDLFNEDEQYI